LGNKNAFRAVANANGKNPLPIVIPCHRVVASGGGLGGYSGHGGLRTKRALLDLESANMLTVAKQIKRRRVAKALAEQ
jgi:methylated-DNA-[protein]-cysteine S-methyltransferase